jgi:hypothetical protein
MLRNLFLWKQLLLGMVSVFAPGSGSSLREQVRMLAEDNMEQELLALLHRNNITADTDQGRELCDFYICYYKFLHAFIEFQRFDKAKQEFSGHVLNKFTFGEKVAISVQNLLLQADKLLPTGFLQKRLAGLFAESQKSVAASFFVFLQERVSACKKISWNLDRRFLLGEFLNLVKTFSEPAWRKFSNEFVEGQCVNISGQDARMLVANILRPGFKDEALRSLFCEWFGRAGRSSQLYRREWLCYEVGGLLDAGRRPYGAVPAERFYDLCSSFFLCNTSRDKLDWRINMTRCLLSMHDYEWRPQPICDYERKEGVVAFYSCVHKIMEGVESLREDLCAASCLYCLKGKEQKQGIGLQDSIGLMPWELIHDTMAFMLPL